jgi:hypothetical protein
MNDRFASSLSGLVSNSVTDLRFGGPNWQSGVWGNET